jgi:dTDP-4-amino-4,6-dideoxygalactose transaminase
MTKIPITKPTLPSFDSLQSRFQEVLASGIVTNGPHVRAFEEAAERKTGVPHAVAVSTCTSGLMLVLKSSGVKGEVILPSFTFSATGHAVLWNHLTPRFVDIEDKHYCLDPNLVEDAITGKTSAILAVHMFGHPARVKDLEAVAEKHRLLLLFDAAHGLGAKVGDQYVGAFGDAEVFSCSPTKLVVTAEGGLVTTKDPELARKIRTGRNYGDDGSYDCEFPGLNARMSELHAIVGLESFRSVDQNVKSRNDLVAYYRQCIGQIDGLSYQEVACDVTHTFKDFSLFIDSSRFGMNRDQLHDAMTQKGIATRKYFYPPLHKQRAYREFFDQYDKSLSVTNTISSSVLSFPLFSHMTRREVDLVVEALHEVHRGD